MFSRVIRTNAMKSVTALQARAISRSVVRKGKTSFTWNQMTELLFFLVARFYSTTILVTARLDLILVTDVLICSCYCRPLLPFFRWWSWPRRPPCKYYVYLRKSQRDCVVIVVFFIIHPLPSFSSTFPSRRVLLVLLLLPSFLASAVRCGPSASSNARSTASPSRRSKVRLSLAHFSTSLDFDLQPSPTCTPP